MTIDDVDALTLVGLHEELWRLQPRSIRTRDDMAAYVAHALNEQRQGTAFPFVIIENASETVVGSTRYFDIAVPHRRLEIGATWITPARQRSAINTEAKLLLLTHAFEVLKMHKVVLKTELLNVQSQRAIERIGARREGVFRKHLIADDGRVRDMVYYGICDEEWPEIKEALRERRRSWRQRSQIPGSG